MILQKSLIYVDLLLKKHFFLLSMLKTVVLLNISVETMKQFLLDSLINKNFTLLHGDTLF